MVITDNALNVVDGQQTVALTGVGTVQPAQITFNGCQMDDTHPACSAVYNGSPIPVTVTTVPAGLPSPSPIRTSQAATQRLPLHARRRLLGRSHGDRSQLCGIAQRSVDDCQGHPIVTWAMPAPLPNGRRSPRRNLTPHRPCREPSLIRTARTTRRACAGDRRCPSRRLLQPGGHAHPADTADYNDGTASVTLIVDKPIWSPSPLNLGNVIEGFQGPTLSAVFPTMALRQSTAPKSRLPPARPRSR